METAVRNLFARYQQFFNRALDGDVDLDEGTSFYASAFIAASPAGVVAGKNDINSDGSWSRAISGIGRQERKKCGCAMSGSP